MTVAFRSATTGLYYADPVVITKPAGVAEGDVLIFAGVNNDASRTLDTYPSGWTELHVSSEATSPGTKMWLAWKLAGASEPSDYSFDFNFAFNGAATIAAFSGSDGTIDASAAAAVSGIQTDTYSATAPSVTTSADNALLIAIYGLLFSSTGVDPAFTVPSGYALETEQSVSYETRHLALATKTLSSAGASGTAVGSWAASGMGNGRTHAFHVALTEPFTGPTLSLAGVQGITASGATPKVTLTF